MKRNFLLINLQFKKLSKVNYLNQLSKNKTKTKSKPALILNNKICK